MTKLLLIWLAFLIPLSGGTALAQAQSCGALWYRRNAVYRVAGYCFKTARAIRAFGNMGCSFNDTNDVPLLPVQRQIVAETLAQERALGCHD